MKRGDQLSLALDARSQRPIPRFGGYAFDLDGTVYLGESLIPGAEIVVAGLRSGGASVVFVTNKPLETATEYAAKLSRLGIPAERTDVVTAIDSLVLYLLERHPDATILTIAERVVDLELQGAGFSLTEAPELASVVVVSFDRTFSYEKLARAYQAVRHGAVIIATNPDPYCPTPDGGLPDCAAMLAALEACSGATAEAILGKPSVWMTRAFLSRLGVAASSSAMVGDRLHTDVAMGIEAGMNSVLVLSGATSESEAHASSVSPDWIIPSITALLN